MWYVERCVACTVWLFPLICKDFQKDKGVVSGGVLHALFGNL